MPDLSRLNEQQLAAVKAIHGPLLLLAGAGTGKTTVITFRIAHMLKEGIDPNSVLALTFTNKAATEMKERVISLVGKEDGNHVTVGTFHSFCLMVLKKYITRLGFDSAFSIADEQLQMRSMKQVVVSLGLKGDDEVTESKAHAYITQRKQNLEYVDQFDIDELEPTDQKYYSIWRDYQQYLKDQALIDFDDLIVLTIKLWRDNPDVLAFYQNCFKYLMVDEYQDTNLSQLQLMRMLAGDVQNICAVGDDDQSIYGWRGADITNILEYEQDFEGTKVIRIENNYRCSGNILAAANHVIVNNSSRYDKTLLPNHEDGSDIMVVKMDDEQEEAESVISMIMEQRLKDSAQYDDFAILFRGNSQSRLLEVALKANDIPYRIVGSASFYDRAEIQDALALLKVLSNSKDDQSLLRILNVPPRGIGSKSVDRLRQMRLLTKQPLTSLIAREEFWEGLSSRGGVECRDFVRVMNLYRQKLVHNGEPLLPGIRNFLNDIGYLPGLMRIYKNRKEAERRLNNVYEFINDVANYMERNGEEATLRDYLLRFMLGGDDDKMDGDEGVTLLTVHSSKGLEFPYVYVVGMEQEQFPHGQSMAEGNLEEERRLFYVAVTRAKKELVLSWSRRRKVYGRDVTREVSQFVNELPQDIVRYEDANSIIKPASQEVVDSMIADFMASFD